ncbi:MAG: ATP synthase F1 subunit gamma [Bacteroidaceae bacterium]|nr:ATP synthase F1 subunit gamma [Bacteroidaceae bacterium]
MSSLKEIKGRIASIRNTQKITSAMRMVASAKLHHVQGMTEAFLRYKDQLKKIVDCLQLRDDDSVWTDDQQGDSQPSNLSHQPSTIHLQPSTILLIPISSNSGLCGAFNSNMTKATLQRIQELEAQGKEVRLLPIGKKIAHELKKTGKDFSADFVDMLDKIEKSNDYTNVEALVAYANGLYQRKKIDSVEFLYHHFKSMGTQVIQTERMHIDPNINPNNIDSDRELTPQSDSAALSSTLNAQHSTFLTEPSPQELLVSLHPRLLNAQAYSILLDSLTSEHAARMMAMQTADDNANDLLKELTLLYNKTRQQAITNELIDIMSGKGVQK